MVSLKEKKQKLKLDTQGLKIVDVDLYNSHKIKETAYVIFLMVIYLILGYFIGYASTVIKFIH